MYRSAVLQIMSCFHTMAPVGGQP